MPPILPLHDAVRAGDLEALRAAIAAGELPDARDAHGFTALLAAVRGGRADLVEALLDAGAHADAHDRKLAPRRWERLGAGVSAQLSGPGTLLHEAAAIPRGANVIRFLLTRGYDIEALDPDGSTPLMIAAHYALGETSGDSSLAALLAAGASIHARDRAGYCVLEAATRPPEIERLLAAGADPNGAASPDGGAYARPLVLRWAALGNAQIVRMLLKAGAKREKAPGALALAAQQGHEQLVNLLIKNGWSPDDRIDDVSALAHAAAFAHIGIVKALLAAGAKELDTALYCAVGDTFLSVTPDIRERQDDRLEVIRTLLAAGARPAAHEPRHAQATPLHAAASVGVAAIAEALLAAGAPVDAKDAVLRTPLFIAAREGSSRVAQLLLKGGADPMTADIHGLSAYEVARRTSTPRGVIDLFPGRGEQMRLMGMLREAGAGPPKPPPPPKAEGPAPGDRVRHAKFGEGTIHAVEGKGEEAKLTIDFGGAGRKVLVAKFVRFEALAP